VGVVAATPADLPWPASPTAAKPGAAATLVPNADKGKESLQSPPPSSSKSILSTAHDMFFSLIRPEGSLGVAAASVTSVTDAYVHKSVDDLESRAHAVTARLVADAEAAATRTLLGAVSLARAQADACIALSCGPLERSMERQRDEFVQQQARLVADFDRYWVVELAPRIARRSHCQYMFVKSNHDLFHLDSFFCVQNVGKPSTVGNCRRRGRRCSSVGHGGHFVSYRTH
jgi:hypothetical protein